MFIVGRSGCRAGAVSSVAVSSVVVSSVAVSSVMAVFFLTGCGGRSLGAQRDHGDGGGLDAGAVDSAVGGFCEGANKVALGSLVAVPAVATASRLVMDCCEGATLHLHTQEVLGDDLVVFFNVAGDSLEPWTYVLDDASPGPEVWVSLSGGDSHPEQQVSGWITLEWQDEDGHLPVLLSCCLQVAEPGDQLDGAHVFVGRQPLASWYWTDRFGLWLLADEDLTAVQAATLPLASLPLAFQPLLALLSVSYYSQSSHRLALDSWYSGAYLVNSLPELGTGGVPFVVTVDEERVYLGAFFTSLSSEGFDGPVIVVEDIGETSFVIEPSYPGNEPLPEPDPRADPRLMELFSSAGKLAP
jgi:hypothetical protein